MYKQVKGYSCNIYKTQLASYIATYNRQFLDFPLASPIGQLATISAQLSYNIW